MFFILILSQRTGVIMTTNTMTVKNGQLSISVDGETLNLDQEFITKAIHDKLYNVAYRAKRNKRIAMLVKLGKQAELKAESK